MGAPRRTYEAPDMGAMLGRTLRAMVRRAAEGDQEVLSVLAQVEGELDQAQRDAARALHDERGYSWAFIGRELGITRQAAQQRFGPAAPLGRLFKCPFCKSMHRVDDSCELELGT